MENSPSSPTTPDTPATQAPRRFGRKVFFLVLALLALTTALLIWTIWTESGTRALFSTAEKLSGGSVKIEGVKGRLRDHLSIAEFSFVQTNLQVTAQAIDLLWSPEELLHKRAHIQNLQISSLRIASASSAEPAQLPHSLALPVAIQADQLALARLSIDSIDALGKTHAETELTALTGQLSVNDKQYQFTSKLNSPWGQIKAQGTLATLSPFALQSKIDYVGAPAKDLPAIAVDADMLGSLQELNLHGQVVTQASEKKQLEPKGKFFVQLMPFASFPLRAAQINLAAINPASFSAQLPAANLALLLDLTQEKGKDKPALHGTIDIVNSQPGLWNQQQIPVQRLQSELQWAEDQLKLTQTRIDLPASGTVKGSVSVQFAKHFERLPQVQGNFALNNLDLSKLDQRIHATQLHGEVQTETVVDQQIKLHVDIQDALASLQAEAIYLFGTATTPHDVLNLNRFELRSADSHLQANGQLQLNPQMQFSLKGDLQHFDPSRWLAIPGGDLSAGFAVNGQIQPGLSATVQLHQLQGNYAGQPLSGEIDADWQQAMVLNVRTLNLQWGRSALTAHGIWGQNGQKLQLSLDAPDLQTWSSVAGKPLAGSVKLDGNLTGKMSEPAGHLILSGQHIAYEKQLAIAKLDAALDLASGLQGAFNADVQIKGVQHINASKMSEDSADATAAFSSLEQASLKVHGTRQAHQLDLNATFNSAHRVEFSASGGLQTDSKKTLGWIGNILKLQHAGQFDYALAAAVPLEISPQLVRLGDTTLRGNLGDIAITQFEWTPDSLKTSGSIKNASVMNIVRLFQQQDRLDGKLKLDAQWQLQLKDSASGEIIIQRQSGDIRLLDSEGNVKPLSGGLSDLRLKINLGGVVPGTDGERIALQFNADGSRIGRWQAVASTVLSRQAGRWLVSQLAPLNGTLTAEVPDLQWVGSWINPGLSLKGKLSLDATLAGTQAKPDYHAKVSGKELEVAFASEGLLLPNGSFDALVDGSKIELQQLRFSNTIGAMPRHDQFREVNWTGQRGEILAVGNMDLQQGTGNIKVQSQKFPLLQRSDLWLVVSGQAELTQAKEIWSLGGKLTADGAYFKLPKLPPPSLSSDVVLSSQKQMTDDSNKSGLQTRVDFDLDMGPRFVFVGRGLDTTLAGDVRLRSNNGGATQASGSIHTVGGVYEGYGQQLAIERGILNFQGSPENPGLNILAYRRGLQVEAGVEVTGTVAAPKVRLASEPDVPDAEKLSWLVLGRGSDQMAGGDASLLMAAAGAIFGGDGGSNMPKEIAQGLGFDEFSVGTADNGSNSRLPSQTIAGATSTGNTSTSNQMVSVGKRLGPGIVLSVERGLGDATGAVKLSWQLTRRVSLVARTGTDSSVDAFYTFSFH